MVLPPPPRYRTPTNSIFFGAGLIAILLILAKAGTAAKEAFATLNNASNNFYGLAYLAMFAIPVIGAAAIRQRIPMWARILCVSGFLSVLFSCTISAYPFLDVPNPIAFATKVVLTTLLVNVVGYAFYKLRSLRVTA